MKRNNKANHTNRQAYVKSLYEVQNLICNHFNEMVISRNMSFYEVSKISNVSIATIYNIKEGRCLPSLYTLLAILTALKEPIGQFFKDCFKNTSSTASPITLKLKQHTLLESKEDPIMVADETHKNLFITLTDNMGNTMNMSLQELISNYYPPKNP